MSVGDDNDELRRLLDDDEFNEASEVGHSLKEMINDYLQNAKPQAVAELTDLKEAIEKSYDDSRKARIAGTTATVTGSVIAITEFGLSFVTLGASLGLTVFGAVLAAAGEVTISGAEIRYLVVSRKKLKKTEKACQENNKVRRTFRIYLRRNFSFHTSRLASHASQLTPCACVNVNARPANSNCSKLG